jgi:hypothetical protein
MAGRDAPAAVNAVVRPVVDYAPDWHGGALFASLTGAAARSLNSAQVVISRAPQWFGWTRELQHMKGAQGAIARQMGGVAPIAPRNSELSKESTTADVNTAAIFASRMARSGSQ